MRSLLWICASCVLVACGERSANTSQSDSDEQAGYSPKTGYSHLLRAGELHWEVVASSPEHIDYSYIALPGEEPGEGPVEQGRFRGYAVQGVSELESSEVIKHLERFASLEFEPPPLDKPQDFHDEATGRARSLAQYLRARMVLAWEERDWDRMVNSFRLGLALADRMLAQENSAEFLTGVAIHSAIVDEASDIILRGGLDRGALAAMTKVYLGVQTLDLLDVAHRGRSTVEQDIHWLYESETELSDEAWANGALERFSGLPEGWHRTARVATRTQCIERGVAFVDGWIANVEAMDAGEDPPFDADAYALTLTVSESPTRVIIGNAHGMILAAVQTRMHQDGLRLDLALAAFRLDSGTYPESLYVLTPKYLNELPKDPFASGDTYGYRRGVRPALCGRPPYWLYSVGSDQVGNSGRVNRQLPAQALQLGLPGSPLREAFVTTPGLDYPLNLPN